MGCIAIFRLSILETLRRKDFYVVLVLLFILAVCLQAINPTGGGTGRFAKDVIMQVVWLASFALAAPLAARQIAFDLEHKTVYVLMSRPIHRWHYILGRAGGATAAAVICFSGMFIVLLGMLALKGAAGIWDPSLWQAFALQVVALAMLCSITVFFSTCSSPAGAVTFSLILLAVMRYGGPWMLHQIDAMQGQTRSIVWILYLLTPHFEFFNISQRVVHAWGALPFGLFAQIFIYGAACTTVAIALGALLFNRRRL